MDGGDHRGDRKPFHSRALVFYTFLRLVHSCSNIASGAGWGAEHAMSRRLKREQT